LGILQLVIESVRNVLVGQKAGIKCWSWVSENCSC